MGSELGLIDWINVSLFCEANVDWTDFYSVPPYTPYQAPKYSILGTEYNAIDWADVY
jgi:hypothetical protein